MSARFDHPEKNFQAEKAAYDDAYAMYNVTTAQVSAYQSRIYMRAGYEADRKKLDAAQSIYCDKKSG